MNGVAQPTSLTALDLSKNRPADQMLAAISAVVMTAGTTGSSSVGNSTNTLLSQIANDLGDDGTLNNSKKYTASVQSRLCAAAASTKFDAVATNLNSVYGTTYKATDLSQWVDTSGCVDQVINKYKFIASSVVPVGTKSQSPAYMVGADDVGQCFSVGGVTNGAAAALYYNGASIAVVGTQLVKAGDSLAIGLTASAGGNYSGFIQRSAAINGTCPTAIPLTGLTRVQKYSISAGPAVGGTVTGLASGNSVTLLNNGADAINVAANGTFAFSSGVALGSTYTVTIKTQPLGQICSVTNGSGTVSATVSNIGVACRATVYMVSTFAGSGASGSNNGVGTSASFSGPKGLAVDKSGNIYVADSANNLIRKITPTGVVSTIVDSRTDPRNGVSSPSGIVIGKQYGYVADTGGNRVPLISLPNGSSDGRAGIFAGSGVRVSADGRNTTAGIFSPRAIAIDSNDNMYVINYFDWDGSVLRKITPDGFVITLAAGSRNYYYSSTNYPYPYFGYVRDTKINTAAAVAVDPNNHVYISAYPGVYKLILNSNANTSGWNLAFNVNSASINSMAFDARGMLYVVDGCAIRMITPAGIASTIAGNGVCGTSDLDGVGTAASFKRPYGIAVDATGNIYVGSDINGSNTIRKLTPQ